MWLAVANRRKRVLRRGGASVEPGALPSASSCSRHSLDSPCLFLRHIMIARHPGRMDANKPQLGEE